MFFLRFRPLFILNVLFVSLLLLGGCKDDDSPNQPPASNLPSIVSFTANPSTVPAGGDSVKLSWKVTGATSLSISGGVGTITPVDSGSIMVFVNATTTFTLTATNSAGSVNSNAGVTASTSISVNGFVKDQDGEPISGVSVIIKGKSPTITDAAGAFSFTNVSAPYEIRLIVSTMKTAIIYEGLTRSDPTLLYIGSTTSDKTATIRGNVPAAPGKITEVIFVSGSKAWVTVANPGTGVYSFSPTWKGSTISHAGKLHVLRWVPNTVNLPAEYDAYGSKALTISDGGLFDNNDFISSDLTDPAEQNITGTIVRPTTSYVITDKSLAINFGNSTTLIAVESGAGLTDDFSYIVPAISGASFEIGVNAKVSAIPSDRMTSFHKKNISGGSSGITITLISAPQLNLPAHNGTGIDTTTQFLWSQISGTGVNAVMITPTAPGPVFYIFCAANSCYIPNLNPQGLGCPPSTLYNWRVVQYFPVTSIDDCASDTFIPLITNLGSDNGMSISELFKFTTAN